MLTVSNREGYEVKKNESIVTALMSPSYSPHSADFVFSSLPPWTKFILAVIRGGRLSYVCIYKTHFFPHNQGETPLFVMPDAGPF